MTKQTLSVAAAALATTFAAAAVDANAASVSVYTDRAAWEAAVTSFSEERFEDDVLNAGITFTTVDGAVDGVLQLWDDRVTELNATTWFFGSSIRAFGGNWDLAGPGGTGLGLQLAFGGENAPEELSENLAGGFWGVVTDFDFNEVLVRVGTQGGSAESYTLDNLVYGNAQQGGGNGEIVPLPSAAAGGLALLGALAIRRRREQNIA